MKKCYECQESKPISNFWKVAKNPDGLNIRCKACLKVQRQNKRQSIADSFQCSVSECGKRATNKTPQGYLCDMHRQRLYLKGEVGDAKSTFLHPGGRGSGAYYLHPDGYRVVGKPGQLKLEHRVLMEQLLGRPLEPHENIHHRNGVRDDNRPENLELWSTSQPKGQRWQDKAEWAIEILKLYCPQILRSDYDYRIDSDEVSLPGGQRA